MKYKSNKNRFSGKGRGNYLSKSDFICKYFMNLDNCAQFFYDMRWLDGYYCEKCGCTHCYKLNNKFRCAECHHDERLLSNTCFQDNKLPLNVLLYGLIIIFSNNISISSMNLAMELKVNYKTATLLQKKCRILMRSSNSRKILDSQFYESDIAYIGAVSKGKSGMASDKQPYLLY